MVFPSKLHRLKFVLSMSTSVATMQKYMLLYERGYMRPQGASCMELYMC